MWLLNTTSYELKEFIGDEKPSYAILSHTWDDEEVTFRDIRRDLRGAKSKAGFSKIKNCCRQARKEELEWAWVDTCCIDKRSSAELTEAINSMFKWYREAEHCYVYLADVSSTSPIPQLRKSRWFTRGWTLQELLAPRRVDFFANDWAFIGCIDAWARSRGELIQELFHELSRTTGIEPDVLTRERGLYEYSIAQRMYWASSRETTRSEDWAYSLMGIFDVNMPILYGEGGIKAFRRLQLEIIKTSADQSIFAWRSSNYFHVSGSGLLAESPAEFSGSGGFTPRNPDPGLPVTIRPFSLSNIGLSVNLPLVGYEGEDIHRRPRISNETVFVASLRCWATINGESKRIQIFLQRMSRAQVGDSTFPLYRRIKWHDLNFVDRRAHIGKRTDIFVLEREHMDYVHLIDMD